ncbi:MAG: NADH-quinone oxidoreductase subunit L [Chitinophagales bacterium]|nr:NADH-quinone oxidoreductase subunit L [Chitinophagales bacterium]
MSDALICLIPALPLLGFLTSNKRLGKTLNGITSSGVILAAFLLSLGCFLELLGGHAPFSYQLFEWMAVGNLHISFSFMVDQLTSLMLLVITGVGFLIHVYSIGYMHDDEGFSRYFGYLNLFIFFMLLLVMGDNYLVMFTGWEGVGLCSYLLIGFWFKNQEYNNAAKKAFIMNRIGDLGFILGILLLFVQFGSFNFAEIFEAAKDLSFDEPMLIAATLLLFIGATGKSAQIPLYTWLPDAMAGPTPVSALIHAATMVTAGIYMIARSNVLYTLAPFTQDIILIVALLTALLAAVIALLQNDIKKVLAYSTVSQLGFMFMALGAGAYSTGMFHVITHAFFKALLFLGAGSVIHAMGGEQDIRKMGGLKGHLKITYATFLIGTLAIAGIFPFAGFFSKDEVLAAVFERNKIAWILGIAASAMTAFYMFRLLFLTFFGEFRGTHHQKEHLHESPPSMTLPLVVLAILSLVGGFMGIPFEHMHWLKTYLEPVFAVSHELVPHHHAELTMELILMGITLTIAIISIFAAYSIYVGRKARPADDMASLGAFQRMVYHKFYIDEIYQAVIVKPLEVISTALYGLFEVLIIDGLVNGSGWLAMAGGRVLKSIQTGAVTYYIFYMVLGLAAILLYNFIN